MCHQRIVPPAHSRETFSTAQCEKVQCTCHLAAQLRNSPVNDTSQIQAPCMHGVCPEGRWPATSITASVFRTSCAHLDFMPKTILKHGGLTWDTEIGSMHQYRHKDCSKSQKQQFPVQSAGGANLLGALGCLSLFQSTGIDLIVIPYIIKEP